MAYAVVGAPPAAPRPAPAQNLPLGITAELIAKAVASPRARPAFIHHRVGEAVRFISGLNGISEDLTPHLPLSILRALAKNNVACQMVLANMIPRWASYYRRPRRDGDIGLRVMLKDHDQHLTAAASKQSKYIEDILFNGGIPSENPDTGEMAVWDGHYETRAHRLQTAIRLLARDSMVLDQAGIEIEGSAPLGDRPKHPVMFWRPTDGARMRFVDAKRYNPQIRNGYNGSDDLTGKVKTVLLGEVAQWQVDREYTWKEADLFIRNPRTDTWSFGYGESEIEQALSAIVGVLYGMKANQEYFDSNHIPIGILNLIGQYNRDEIGALRTQLQQEIGLGGSGGMYDFPIVSTKEGAGAAWIPVQPKDQFAMVSEQYIQFCVAVVCAIFQIAPEEIGMTSFGGPDQTLNTPDPESKFKQSQSRNELPKVLLLCEFLSKNLVDQIDPDFECVIQGLESVYNPELLLKAQLEQQLLANGRTPNEIAAMNDEAPRFQPKNRPLWRQVEEKLENTWFETHAVRMFAVADAYEKAGGELMLWPDLPIGSQLAFQAASQEAGLQEQQDTQDQMGKMASGEAQHQQGMEGDEASGAREAMSAQASAADERQAGLQQVQDQADQKGEIRVPGMADAAGGKFQRPPTPAGPVAGPGAKIKPKRPGQPVQKSAEPEAERSSRIVVRIGVE